MDVVIKETKSYKLAEVINSINEGIQILGGWDKYVKPGAKVLLKINLIGPKKPESSAVTHCEFVRAISRILKSKGCEVWIGDSSGGAIAGISPTKQSFNVAGFNKVAEEEGANIKNFDKEGVKEVISKSGLVDKMYLASPMFEADVVINVPKFKTHSAAIFTGAVKNVFGCIPGLKKAEYHKIAPDPKDFGELVIDINEGLNIDLHIMDGIEAMEGEGPTAGKPYKTNKILISDDPVALDVIATKMIGLDIEQVPILETARKRNFGESNINNILIKGDYSEIPQIKNFKMPKRLTRRRKSNNDILIKVIDFLKTRPKIDKNICRHCNMCVESCPVNAIDKNNKVINYDICIECMCCHELCMYEAVKLKKDNLFAEIITKILSKRY